MVRGFKMVMEMRMMVTWRFLIGGLIIQFCCASQLQEVSLATWERKDKTGVKVMWEL